MRNQSLILNPWHNLLYQELSKARQQIYIVSPFIKLGVVKKVRGAIPNDCVEVLTLTRFKQLDFEAGASDVDAVWSLSEWGGGGRYQTRFLNALHAKIYVIDRMVAFLGSSNLTFSGLSRNVEACIMTNDETTIHQITQSLDQMWSGAKTLQENDFSEMVQRLVASKNRVSRESDHSYDLSRPLDLYDPKPEDAWIPPPSFIKGVPSLTLATEKYAPIAETQVIDVQPEESLAAEETALTLEDYAKIHQKRSNAKAIEHEKVFDSFMSKLDVHFHFTTQSQLDAFAIAICSGVIPKYRALPPREDAYQPKAFDVDTVWRSRKRQTVLTSIGMSVYRSACFSAAYKSGLINRLGPSGLSLLASASDRLKTLADYWHQNFLGPLFLATEEQISAQSYQTASYRLLGAVSLSAGLGAAVDLAEEFFNPLDLIEGQLTNIVGLTDPKTALQELTLSQNSKYPIYGEYNSVGSSHDPAWSCSVVVEKSIKEIGRGTSKRAAETEAAAAMLSTLESVAGWAKQIFQLKEKTLSKTSQARFAVTPSRRLRSAERALVIDAYSKILGVSVDPDYGYLALSVPDTMLSSQFKIKADNRLLAHYGHHLVEWLINRAYWAEGDDNAYIDEKIYRSDGLVEGLEVDALRAAIGLKDTLSNHQKLDVVQAIFAAVQLSNEHEDLVHTFAPKLEAIRIKARLYGALTKEASSSIAGMRAVTAEFTEDLDYTTMYQEHCLGRKESLPTYTFSDKGLTNDRVYTASIDLGSAIATGVGRSKRTARNRAAYEALRIHAYALPLGDRLDQS